MSRPGRAVLRDVPADGVLPAPALQVDDLELAQAEHPHHPRVMPNRRRARRDPPPPGGVPDPPRGRPRAEPAGSATSDAAPVQSLPARRSAAGRTRTPPE